MTLAPDSGRPSHVLVFGPIEETSTEVAVANAALQPVLDRGTEASLYLDAEQFSAAYPERLEAFEECCDRDDEGPYRCSLDACVGPLMTLLSVETWHRFVAVESLRVDGPSWSLWYVPDHRTFELYGDGDVAAAVRTATEGQPVALLSAGERVSWTQGGRRYVLDPPSLCVENRCYTLSKLRGIDIDREAGTVDLSWGGSSGLLGRLVEHVMTSPPERLSIADPDDFERVADTLDRLRTAWGLSE